MSGIYLHIPFCEKKCFYCDFYSVETKSNNSQLQSNAIVKFTNSLIKEIDLRSFALKVNNSKFDDVSTVFFGGGTPSLLEPELLKRIIEVLKSTFSIDDDAEWTMESNPGTIDKESLIKYKEIGINRISIGVQSFVDGELKFLQRIHDSKEAKNAILDSKSAGFTNMNIDIIFSIPGQSKQTLQTTLDTIKKIMPEHISAYSLIYEKNTPLYNSFINKKIKKINDDTDAQFYELLANYLINLGYEHYEVSNFALPGFKCQHNLNYWKGGDYIGLGPSAHGYLGGRRYWNVKSLEKYNRLIEQNRLAEDGFEILTNENKIHEKIMLGLRSDGINFNEFKNEFDIDLYLLGKNSFKEWYKSGLCEFDLNHFRLNARGYAICNTLINKVIDLI